MSDPFNPFVHKSQSTDYLHTDYGVGEVVGGKIHLNLSESQFLAQKRGIELRPGSNVSEFELDIALGRK